MLVHALICGRVDCGNAVYVTGLSSTNAAKLQSVLNAAARLMGAPQSSHIFLLSSETLASYSSTHPIQGLLPHEELFYWLCSTIPQCLLQPNFFYRPT